MTWAECNSAVRKWMETQGWPVKDDDATETPTDFVHRIYAWQHDGADECYTLWITEKVVEDNEPVELIGYLNSLGVAEMLRKRPDLYTILKSSPSTGVVAEQSAEKLEGKGSIMRAREEYKGWHIFGWAVGDKTPFQGAGRAEKPVPFGVRDEQFPPDGSFDTPQEGVDWGLTRARVWINDLT